MARSVIKWPGSGSESMDYGSADLDMKEIFTDLVYTVLSVSTGTKNKKFRIPPPPFRGHDSDRMWDFGRRFFYKIQACISSDLFRYSLLVTCSVANSLQNFSASPGGKFSRWGKKFGLPVNFTFWRNLGLTKTLPVYCLCEWESFLYFPRIKEEGINFFKV